MKVFQIRQPIAHFDHFLAYDPGIPGTDFYKNSNSNSGSLWTFPIYQFRRIATYTMFNQS